MSGVARTTLGVGLGAALHLAASGLTFGVLMNRDMQTCVSPYGMGGDRSACSLITSQVWPLYWVYRVGYMVTK